MASDSFMALITNKFASVRVAGASLPSPAQDPNPAATLALHNLWQSLRAFVRLGPNGPTFQAPEDEPELTPAAALARVGDLLVSFLLF